MDNKKILTCSLDCNSDEFIIEWSFSVTSEHKQKSGRENDRPAGERDEYIPVELLVDLFLCQMHFLITVNKSQQKSKDLIVIQFDISCINYEWQANSLIQ